VTLPEHTMSSSENPTFASRTPVRIGGVALYARDPVKLAAYYQDVLGLTCLEEAAGRFRLGVEALTLLELEPKPDAAPDDPASAGLFHTAFLMPTRADLAHWLVHYGRLDLPLDGASDHGVSEAIYLSDPEGNGIEVYADRPPETWDWGQDGLAMGTWRLDMRALLAAAPADDKPYTAAPAGLRVGHIHLRVGDIREAEAFYGGIVGLDVTVRVHGATFMSSGRYHHHLGANTWRSANAGRRDENRSGLAWFTIEAEADELAGIRARLDASRIDYETTPDGLAVADPWGIIVRLEQRASG
jgi:catechol 2,3-dioxygenase